MRIAILGFGAEGRATSRFLKKKYPKAELTILDQKYGSDYLKSLESFDVVYRSPGVPYNLKEIQRAIRKGIKLTSSTEAFLLGARGTVVGVTGTKGKSTTATLIHNVLKEAGRDTYIAGNIGKPAIDLLPQLRKNSISIIELSSFQLQGINCSPHIAVILDIFPEHLDTHKTFKEYLDAKRNIVLHQKKDDFVFYAPDNKYSSEVATASKGYKVAVSSAKFPVNLSIPGTHNIKNAAMAAAVLSHLDVSPIKTLEVISSFRGLPYRLKLSCKKNKVSFYNDSASTNPETAAVALASFPGKSKILIAGGRDKNFDYKPLRDAVRRENVRLVVLFGENKEKIKRAVGHASLVHTTTSLDKAVKFAFKNAEQGDYILFSPGAASFDMFDNYKERGKEFDRIARNLKQR